MKILHVGNIANNAYLAAKWERQLGIDSIVISPEMNHVMSFPAWEENNLMRTAREHFVNPDEMEFFSCGISWFYSGTWSKILSNFSNVSQKSNLSKHSKYLGEKIFFVLLNYIRQFFIRFHLPKARLILNHNLLGRLRIYLRPKLNEFFKLFDIVVVYGPYAEILSSLNLPRTIAIEHGTLRDYIWQNSFLAKKTLKGYQNANYILVTNSDCLSKSEDVKFSNCQVMKSLHPVNSDFSSFRQLRLQYLSRESDDFRILIPSRWSLENQLDPGKGLQLMLEVIKYFKEETNIKFFAIKWGDGVNFYQELLKDNDCDRNVHWLDLQSRIRLRTLISTSDLVCDQFVIPAFGGVAIDSLGIGTPLITKVNRADELNFYGAISPVLNADDTGGILGHITALMQGKISFRDYFRSSTNFFDFYLHENLSGSKRIQIYRELMNLI